MLLRIVLGQLQRPQRVLTLAGQGLIKHHVVPVKLDDVNDTLEALGPRRHRGARRRGLRLILIAYGGIGAEGFDRIVGVGGGDCGIR